MFPLKNLARKGLIKISLNKIIEKIILAHMAYIHTTGKKTSYTERHGRLILDCAALRSWYIIRIITPDKIRFHSITNILITWTIVFTYVSSTVLLAGT